MKHTFDDVLNKAKEYISNEQSLKLITDAYLLARDRHEGQFRKSKDPYIQHPIEVAYILAELQTSPQTIAVGFLHDVLEDTEETKEDLTAKFGEDIVSMVDGVTKIGKLKYMTKEKALVRSHQKILLAMAKDIRVVLVKLVDRVHNMRTLEHLPREKQVRIAQETLDLYVPLAHRIGMYRIKAELEDTAFKYLEPETYQSVTKEITDQREVREEDIKRMSDALKVLLDDHHVKNYEIKGRLKNIYSIVKKMQTKQLRINEIYDLMALRILVPTVEACYQVLGLVHGSWSPIPKRFKDYIATPKPNLYQSLHTTVVGIGGKVYEIQIRTFEMDAVAEYGVAAHWAYKESRQGFTSEKAQMEVSSKLKWYRDLLEYVEMDGESDFDPLSDIKEDIFSANVYVFTPKGDPLDFPQGSTPLDFAYRIHTEVGDKTVGAIVNGKIVPLSYKLQTGDVIEIKTSKQSQGPNKSWLKLAKTRHARHKITSFLNKKQRDDFIKQGIDSWDRVAKEERYNGPKLDDSLIESKFSKYKIDTVEDFYYEIGKNNISPKAAMNILSGDLDQKTTDEILMQTINEKKTNLTRQTSALGVIVEGLDNAKIKLASCCFPLYGDEIIGYITKGRGIVVHRANCPNISEHEMQRTIPLSWDTADNNHTYEIILTISSFNRNNIIAEIINVLNSMKVYIKAISSKEINGGTDILTDVRVAIQDTKTLTNVIVNLQKISDIYEIKRGTR